LEKSSNLPGTGPGGRVSIMLILIHTTEASIIFPDFSGVQLIFGTQETGQGQVKMSPLGEPSTPGHLMTKS
jgi:hypothetical protein